ncbi:uncharacterized protein RJT21DRAFT_83085 [Scheffersomyces amazonensis]|uniref:uncharacterized protein n=1 Tax=Scheffersomyces amazonensis TaxID=1078765 RepID=UPI00315C905B
MSSTYRPRGGYSSRGRPRSQGYGQNQSQSQSQSHYQSHQSSNTNSSYRPQNNNNYRYQGNRNNYYQQYSNNSNSHNNNSGQETSFQIWMGDLDPTWNEEKIIELWKSVDEKPTAVKIKLDKLTLKPIYCFVSFETQQAMEKAINKNGLAIPGTTRSFRLNKALGSTNFQSNNNNNNNVPLKKLPLRNDYSIFIGDLDPSVTESNLMDVFNNKFPKQVIQVRIMFDPATKTSKGFGFAKFNSQETMEKALEELDGIIVGGRAIRVGQAANSSNNVVVSSENKVIETRKVNINHSQIQPPLNQFTDPNNTTLLINGLGSKFSEDDLTKHFLSFGDIVSLKLSNDFTSATIQYYFRSSAETALLLLHGSIINNCRIDINWGKPQEDNYHKQDPAPIVYAPFGVLPIRFDKIKRDEIDSLSGQSGPIISVNDANKLYVQAKYARDQLLNDNF